MSILYKYLRICICIHKIDEKIVILKYSYISIFANLHMYVHVCVYFFKKHYLFTNNFFSMFSVLIKPFSGSTFLILLLFLLHLTQ